MNALVEGGAQRAGVVPETAMPHDEPNEDAIRGEGNGELRNRSSRLTVSQAWKKRHTEPGLLFEHAPQLRGGD